MYIDQLEPKLITIIPREILVPADPPPPQTLRLVKDSSDNSED